MNRLPRASLLAALGMVALVALAGHASTRALFADSASVAANTFTTATWVINTGLRNPTADAPVAGFGDGDGYQSNPTRAYTDNNQNAQDQQSGTANSLSCTSTARDKHVFWGYNAGLPGGAVVDGIEVRLDVRSNNATGDPAVCVELSRDGGATWTAATVTPVLTGSMETYLLGGSADLWGATWTAAQANNVRVRLTMVANATNKNFVLDWVAVRIYYH